MKTVIVQCTCCGYQKMMQLDSASPNYKDLRTNQTDKDCPNCLEHNSLREVKEFEYER